MNKNGSPPTTASNSPARRIVLLAGDNDSAIISLGRLSSALTHIVRASPSSLQSAGTSDSPPAVWKSSHPFAGSTATTPPRSALLPSNVVNLSLAGFQFLGLAHQHNALLILAGAGGEQPDPAGARELERDGLAELARLVARLEDERVLAAGTVAAAAATAVVPVAVRAARGCERQVKATMRAASDNAVRIMVPQGK